MITRLKRGPMERKAMELLCYSCKKTTNIEHGSKNRKKRNTTNKGKRLSHRARACTFSFFYLHYFSVCKIIYIYVFIFKGVFYTYPTSISKIIYTQH
jgi:hypothetical protein